MHAYICAMCRQFKEKISNVHVYMLIHQCIYIPSNTHISLLPPPPPLPRPHRASQTKLLRLERDNRELERTLQVLKQSNERAAAERENTNKKLTSQIHSLKKEIAKLKEVSNLLL